MKSKRKTALKKKVRKRKKAYFFTENKSKGDSLTALAVDMGGGKIPIVVAENKARTIALKKKLKLAGGFWATGEKPNDLKKTINVPFKTKQTERARDIVDDIMEYESGEMSEKDLKKMFQRLVDTGQAWSLQGHYGRTAQAMIDKGLIKAK